MFESNGPDVKIRGTASHVAEKYIQLARDAQASGDPVGAENYYQHAEHYFRLIATAQEQLRQNQPQFGNRPENTSSGNDSRDGTFDDEGDDESVRAGNQRRRSRSSVRAIRSPICRAMRSSTASPASSRTAATAARCIRSRPRRVPRNTSTDCPRSSPAAVSRRFRRMNKARAATKTAASAFQGERHERQGFRRRRRHRGGYRNDGPPGAAAGHDGGDDPSA